MSSGQRTDIEPGRMAFTLSVQELREPNNLHKLSVRWHTSIKDVKDKLHQLTRAKHSQLQLFHATSSQRLSNSLTLHDLGIDGNGHVLRLSINDNGTAAASVGRSGVGVITPSRDVIASPESERLIHEVSLGLRCGAQPLSTDIFDCTGGVYFLRNADNLKAAVFKPYDEEQGMPNNSKGYEGNGDRGLRENFKPGQGCIREFAAYILDEGNLANVPTTTLVHCEHPALNYAGRTGSHTAGSKHSIATYPKLGSLQQFVKADCVFDDIGPGLLSDYEVQKIALLDLRLLNCDRNASNILVVRKEPQSQPGSARHEAARPSRSGSLSSYESAQSRSDSECVIFLRENDEDECTDLNNRRYSFGSISRSLVKEKEKEDYVLVPIDHGYCLPTSLAINEWDWCWFHLPHVKRPLHPRLRDYILGLDFEATLAKLVAQIAITEESVFLLRLAHHVLVTGIKAGLTLHDIASLIARIDEDQPSPLERAIDVAAENAHRAIELRSGRLDSRGHLLSSNSRTRGPPMSSQKQKMYSGSGSGSGSERSEALRSSLELTIDPVPLGMRTLKGLSIELQCESPRGATKTSEAVSSSPSDGATSSASTGSVTGSSGGGAFLLEAFGNRGALFPVSDDSDERNTEGEAHIRDAGDRAAARAGDHDSGRESDSPSPPTITPAALAGVSLGLAPLAGEALRSLQSVDQYTFHAAPWGPLRLSSNESSLSWSGSDARSANSSPRALSKSSSGSSISGKSRPLSSPLKCTGSDEQLKTLSAASAEKPAAARSPVSTTSSSALSFSTSSQSAPRSKKATSKVSASCAASTGRTRRPKGQKMTRETDGTVADDEEPVDLKDEGMSTSESSHGSDDGEDDDSKLLSLEELPHARTMLRVASFAAFDNPPIYDAESSERRFGRLNRERRRQIANTDEFRSLRMQFVRERVGLMVRRNPVLA